MDTQSGHFIKRLAQEYLLKLGTETHGYISKHQLHGKPVLNGIIDELVTCNWMSDVCDEYYEINSEAIEEHIKEINSLMTKPNKS